MLLAKVLIQSKQYAAADRLLQKIKVLPNEGATAGRQLYREVKLMLALENMKSGNCKKALQNLSDAKLWPENLGSGKPYENEIDTRLEDWLSYQCFVKSGNQKAAKQMLDNIITETDRTRAENNPSVSNLIAAWALKKAGKAEDGEKLLKEVAAKHPSNSTAQWALDAYNGRISKLNDESDTYRVLEQWLAANPQ
jgi:hypothetical protein